MKAGHCHIQKNRRGRGIDHIPMIQRIFTHTKSKSTTDHDHVQLIQRIFTHTKSKSITDHDHIQLIQGIFTQRALQIENTITFKSQRQSQSHVLWILFIRYCAEKTSPKITIPLANTFTEKWLQTFRHFPTKTI